MLVRVMAISFLAPYTNGISRDRHAVENFFRSRYRAWRRRVTAARLAARDRTAGPFVLAACFAALDRSVAVRRDAAARACRASAARDTLLLGSRRSAASVARPRRRDGARGRRRPWPVA